MGATIIEKIIGAHSGRDVSPGDTVDVVIDSRVARDFGGANVVKNMEDHGLTVDDAGKTYFTFDCNPGGSDQKYAANQQICRGFARARGIPVYDVNAGIGTHIAIDDGLVGPGGTIVSTDSHANILGAIGAFGQGMGDQDIASAWAHGKVWFNVPKSMRVFLDGTPGPAATPKDIVLACLRHFHASGLLGFAGEYYGEAADLLSLDGRITVASMATEMGGIITFFPPSNDVIEYCRAAGAESFTPAFADPDARYDSETRVDIDGLAPLIARPGHPDDVVEVSEVAGRKIDSAFIGSCTNGRYEDMVAAAAILKSRKVAPGVVLKVVPSTDRIWQRCLEDGIIQTFKTAGALVGNAGCAGCAAGQLGQNGPGEVTISTGNRNYPGKQGKGEVYLASPATAAASAVAGEIATADSIPDKPSVFMPDPELAAAVASTEASGTATGGRPTVVRGKVWVVGKDNVDTDMIFHNRHLAITDLAEMGQHTFGNLPGWESFPTDVARGDIVIVGSNFGCGSSRQQAVDCFASLGVSLVIAESFGAIYERNAINAGMPIMAASLSGAGIESGDEIEVDLTDGTITHLAGGKVFEGRGFSDVQMEIYQRGGLLAAA
ncbi:MAG: aconitase/3-isopropylmalate dehydratase large subunit family protein [Candidatus Eisenbacteria bacterium]